MRWAEIIAADPRDPETPWPTYQQIDRWTRRGLLHAPAGRGEWRDWPAEEVEVAKRAVRLMAAGLTTDTAFRVARARPGSDGVRVVVIGYHIAVHIS